MYLLELFINDDHALASKNENEGKKSLILFNEAINLKMPDNAVVSYPIGKIINLSVLKTALQLFKTKKKAETWASEFKTDYETSIDKDSEGNERFSFEITKLI